MFNYLYLLAEDVKDMDLVALGAELSELQRDCQWIKLEKMFEEADVEQMPIIMMIALLRYTYISRHWIPSWKNFLYRCKVELITMRDETRNVDELFQGLDRESNDTSN